MTTKIPSHPDTDGSWATYDGNSGSRLRRTRRRRSVPHLLLGALLVLACAAAFLVVSLRSESRQVVLALARPVSVGQTLAVEDLREVNVAVEAGVSVVAVDQAAGVVGKTMSMNLPAGALLTPEAVSGTGGPPTGQALAALSLKAGQFPPEVAPGTHVSVVFVPVQAGAGLPSAPTADATTVWPAVVNSVTAPEDQQITVISVQVTTMAARQIAAVPAGQLSVVMLPGGGQ